MVWAWAIGSRIQSLIRGEKMKAPRIIKIVPRPVGSPSRFMKIERQQPLLTDEVRARLPPLYATEALELHALAQVKFFIRDSNWTWYASDGSPVDADGYSDTGKEKVDFFFSGLVVGPEIEVGYFALSELEAIRGPSGLPIERDEWFTPTPLARLKEMHEDNPLEGSF